VLLLNCGLRLRPWEERVWEWDWYRSWPVTVPSVSDCVWKGLRD